MFLESTEHSIIICMYNTGIFTVLIMLIHNWKINLWIMPMYKQPWVWIQISTLTHNYGWYMRVCNISLLSKPYLCNPSCSMLHSFRLKFNLNVMKLLCRSGLCVYLFKSSRSPHRLCGNNVVVMSAPHLRGYHFNLGPKPK